MGIKPLQAKTNPEKREDVTSAAPHDRLLLEARLGQVIAWKRRRKAAHRDSTVTDLWRFICVSWPTATTEEKQYLFDSTK